MTQSNIYSCFEDMNTEDLFQFYRDIYAWDIKPIAKGEGIKVAVLDSGIDILHPFMLNKIHYTHNALLNKNDHCIDKVGHGTFIAGLISSKVIGLAPNVSLYCVKITDDRGQLTTDTIKNGVKWAMNENVDIICMAFGGSAYDAKLDELFREAEKREIICLAAAGNNPETISYPAKYDSVICVAGVDYALAHAPFSGRGEQVDIALPAIDIPSIFSFSRFAHFSGSSASTGIATGIISMIQFLKIRAAGAPFNRRQLLKWIENNRLDLGEPGRDELYGIGVPSFHRFKEKKFNLTYFKKGE